MRGRSTERTTSPRGIARLADYLHNGTIRQSELYWNVEGDRTPLLTVTNFSDTTERIDIWATRDSGSRILRTVELPAKASVHINMQQDFTQRGAELESLKSRNFGGFFIRAQSPTAKVLVKEHIFSLSKQVASPYYGSPGLLVNHQIIDSPSWMTAGQVGTAGTYTCYSHCCFENEWAIHSSNPSVVSVQNPYAYVPRTLTAHSPGSVTLSSQASGPINEYGDIGYFDSYRGASVYDSTPVINAIVPNTIPAGGSISAEIYGSNFGVNPTFTATGGITITPWYWSPNQINATFSAPATPPGTYSVTVTSNGLTGVFLQAPGGGSQSQSQPQSAQVKPTISVTPDGWKVTATSIMDPAIVTSEQLLAESNPPATVGFSWLTSTPDKISLNSTPAKTVQVNALSPSVLSLKFVYTCGPS